MNNTKLFFYSIWFISLLLQAFFTELTSDEAYYWMYSRELAWGYFDHPPVISLIIKLGYSLFSNELGVRIIPVILSTLTIFLLELIIQPKDLKIFYLLVASIGILHFIGFYAIPDSPLIFTSAVFLLLYKKFTITPNIQKSVLLGIIIALMCMSKYHGIIIIGLTVLSNLKLLTNRYFWLCVIIVSILLTPHLLWQISTGFPSIHYHFFERSNEVYKLGFTFEYLASQLIVLGPITGIIFFIAAYKVKASNQFEKTLKVLFWGGYIFFFIMSFKGRVEGHWTLFVVLPAIYFGYHYLIKLKKKNQVINYVFSISLILILIVRVFVAVDIKPDDSLFLTQLTKQFRNKDNMQVINQLAENRPVAFMNSYQDASLYSFYTNSEGFSLNNIMGRKNQFDLWNVEDRYRGKDIMMIPNYNAKEFERIEGIPKTTRYTFIDNFQSYSRIKLNVSDIKKKTKVSDTLKLEVILKDTKNKNLDFNVNSNYPSYIHYQFFEGKNLVKDERVYKITNDMLDKSHPIEIVTPVKQGCFGLYFSIRTGWLPATINSERYEIISE